MKYLKFTLFMFAVCLMMSYLPAKARDVAMVSELKVKAYQVETKLGWYKTKTEDFTTHTYQNSGSVKLYGNGDYSNILVKICNDKSYCTAYKEFKTLQKQTYNESKASLKGKYTLKFKNPNFIAYRLSHAGVWVY